MRNRNCAISVVGPFDRKWRNETSPIVTGSCAISALVGPFDLLTFYSLIVRFCYIFFRQLFIYGDVSWFLSLIFVFIQHLNHYFVDLLQFSHRCLRVLENTPQLPGEALLVMTSLTDIAEFTLRMCTHKGTLVTSLPVMGSDTFCATTIVVQNVSSSTKCVTAHDRKWRYQSSLVCAHA
jgi:hypothetical protein